MHEEFRLAAIDHQISQAPREPVRLAKMRHALSDMEAKLDSQKLLVSEMDKEIAGPAQSSSAQPSP